LERFHIEMLLSSLACCIAVAFMMSQMKWGKGPRKFQKSTTPTLVYILKSLWDPTLTHLWWTINCSSQGEWLTRFGTQLKPRQFCSTAIALIGITECSPTHVLLRNRPVGEQSKSAWDLPRVLPFRNWALISLGMRKSTSVWVQVKENQSMSHFFNGV
jgi:hypothetical protein